MTKYGSDDLIIKVDNNAGVLTALTQYVDEINGVNVEALTEEGHTFGDSWFEQLATGMKKMEPIEIGGFYDDTAVSGPDVILYEAGAALGATRTLELTYGSTKVTTVECIIQKYTRIPRKGQLTRFKATLLPTGAVSEA